MAQSDSREGGAENARAIREALTEAERQYVEYKRIELRAAAAGYDPTEQPEVVNQKIDLHTAIMTAFMKLRPYIKEDLHTEYWAPEKAGNAEETGGSAKWPHLEFFDPHAEKQRGGLQVLDGWHEPYATAAVETGGSRHRGGETRVEAETVLPEASKYSLVLDLLNECKRELGFGPRARRRRPLGRIPSGEEAEEAARQAREEMKEGEA